MGGGEIQSTLNILNHAQVYTFQAFCLCDSHNVVPMIQGDTNCYPDVAWGREKEKKIDTNDNCKPRWCRFICER